MKTKIYKITLMLILATFSIPAISQEDQRIAYYDAELLATAYKNGGSLKAGDSIVKLILKYYYKPDTNVRAEVVNNPFLTKYIKEGGSASLGGGGSASFFSKAGSADVTQIVNVLSDIIIEHGKQELTIAFFERFKKFVNKHEEFKVMFPQTTANFSNLITYKYSEMLPTLRSGFFDDINKLTYHLDDLMQLPKYQVLLQKFPEVRVVVHTLRVFHELESGASTPPDAINDLAAFEEWKDPETPDNVKNMGNSIKVAAIFSQSLRKMGDNLWIEPVNVRKMINDKAMFDIYLGLLYAQSIKEDIQFKVSGETVAFSELMKTNAGNLVLFKNKVTEFISLAQQVSNAYEKIKGLVATNDDIYGYINTSADVIQYSFSIANLFRKDIDMGNYITVVKSANNLYKGIYSKQYNQAVTHALEIVSQISAIIKEHKVETSAIVALDTNAQKDLVARVAKDNTLYVRLDAKDEEKLEEANKTINSDKLDAFIGKIKNQRLAGFIEKLRPYALFMANMVDAKTDAQVKAALESAILPVGSSTIKKYSNWNLAIQSYIGARYGEADNGNTVQNSWNDKVGISVPIGIGVSYGFGKWGSATAFVPLVDIGAAVDYKLNDTGKTDAQGKKVAEKDYKIELGQIFSPGLYLVYGFPFDLPISIGGGYQYGPGLSKIKEDNTTVINNPYWKFNVFLSVDIPLCNLSNNAKVKAAK